MKDKNYLSSKLAAVLVIVLTTMLLIVTFIRHFIPVTPSEIALSQTIIISVIFIIVGMTKHSMMSLLIAVINLIAAYFSSR